MKIWLTLIICISCLTITSLRFLWRSHNEFREIQKGGFDAVSVGLLVVASVSLMFGTLFILRNEICKRRSKPD